MANTNGYTGNTANLENLFRYKPEDKERLYAILNLPVFATPTEIKDRHRQLSIILHPDKQRDDESRESATRLFQQVQRAYEVLSDPFLREVYDLLGEDGLKLKFTPNLRALPGEELRKILKQVRGDIENSVAESRLQTNNRVLWGIDASSLFDDDEEDVGYRPLSQRFSALWDRIRRINRRTYTIRSTLQRNLNSSTQLTLKSELSQGAEVNIDIDPGSSSERYQSYRSTSGKLMGTLRHQFSPQFTVETSTNFLRLSPLQISSSYITRENTVVTSLSLFPALRDNLPVPPFTVALSRKLFPSSSTQGSIAIQVVPHLSLPGVTVGFRKPLVLTSAQTALSNDFIVGWSLNLNLQPNLPGPNISADVTLYLTAVALRIKTGIEVSFIEIASFLTGEWISEDEKFGFGTTVTLASGGVGVRLRVTHLGQTLVVPIKLCSGHNTSLALVTAVIPSVAFYLVDCFLLRPRRILKRRKRIETARQDAEETISRKRREAEDYVTLLGETAKRHTKAERDSNGLVILEALYVPIDEGGGVDDALHLSVNVTVPLQALVHNGQLIIPGSRSKSSLQGFYDPLPEFTKQLRIRYEFRGRMHYVEKGEFEPVILPMEDHLVD